jgi:hypothetical protein
MAYATVMWSSPGLWAIISDWPNATKSLTGLRIVRARDLQLLRELKADAEFRMAAAMMIFGTAR